jgi:hypothetical protein
MEMSGLGNENKGWPSNVTGGPGIFQKICDKKRGFAWKFL